MKKMNILKIAFTLVLAFVITGTFAQTHDGTAVPGGATAGNYADNTTQAYMIEGSTIPVYVMPDSYYHPLYNPTTSTWTLTDGFNWLWSGTATTSLTVTSTIDDNYATVTAAAGDAGAYVLTVAERAPVAYGGCTGGAQNLTINVVEVPGVTIGGDATYDFCELDAGLPADIQSTITGGWQNYRMTWTLEIATLNASSAKEFYYDDENGSNQAVGQKYAVEYTEAAPQDVAAAAGAPDLMTVGAYNVIDNNGAAAGGDAVTVYTYVLNKINDQASRFGDFIGLAGDDTGADDTYTYYPVVAAPETVVVTVYPAPTTGPIYHIDNTWAI